MLWAKKRSESLVQQTRTQQQERYNHNNNEKWYIRGKKFSPWLRWKKNLCNIIIMQQQEQLLEQQQELELLRIARLRELEKKKLKFSERTYKGKNIREHTIFYTTVTLAFFSVSAGASILFLVPLYVGKFWLRERATSAL